jgi:hypothetical protein
MINILSDCLSFINVFVSWLISDDAPTILQMSIIGFPLLFLVIYTVRRIIG